MSENRGGGIFLTHTVGNGDRCCNFHNPVECYNINVLLTLLTPPPPELLEVNPSALFDLHAMIM